MSDSKHLGGGGKKTVKFLDNEAPFSRTDGFNGNNNFSGGQANPIMQDNYFDDEDEQEEETKQNGFW